MSQAILPLFSDHSSDPARLLRAKSPFDAPSPVKLSFVKKYSDRHTEHTVHNQGIHIR